VIFEAVDPNANIIFGALVDESMEGEIAITVIATGFPVGKSDDDLDEFERATAQKTVGDMKRLAAQQRTETIARPIPASQPVAAPQQPKPRAQPRPAANAPARPSSRIVSTDDDDFPDFLTKLRRNR